MREEVAGLNTVDRILVGSRHSPGGGITELLETAEALHALRRGKAEGEGPVVLHDIGC
jgi:hypothetical protein